MEIKVSFVAYSFSTEKPTFLLSLLAVNIYEMKDQSSLKNVEMIIILIINSRVTMEKIESALDVLSRAATMVQPCPAYPASDSDSFGM